MCKGEYIVNDAKVLYDAALKLYLQNTEESLTEAIEHFKAAAENDPDFGQVYTLSYYYIGKIYEKNRDYENAFKKFNRARKCTDTHHLVLERLGTYHYTGTGTSKNIDEAYHYFLKGSKAGNGICDYYVGLIHYKGEIGEKSDKQFAFECFKKAHEKEIEKASFLLACCYENGIGTKKDLKAAIGVLDEFQNKPDCLIKAGKILKEIGSFSEAKKRFLKALEIGIKNPETSKEIKDEIYNITHKYIPNDIERSLENCGKDFSDINAVIQKYTDFNSEIIYDRALLQEKAGNIILAVRLFLLAAANGCKKAQYTLHNMSAPGTKYFTEIIEHR